MRTSPSFISSSLQTKTCAMLALLPLVPAECEPTLYPIGAGLPAGEGSNLVCGFAVPRHCEEPRRGDEAIQASSHAAPGLLRFARNDGLRQQLVQGDRQVAHALAGGVID